jgi:GT2 family glycosyltransferase
MSGTAADEAPFVRVVVLNYDGGQMTIDCIESILATEYPAGRLEVVMVDNGSLDDVVERVRRELPTVRVLEPLANTGFAGGCNLGIRAPGEFDVLALVNNDAEVDPGWLWPLVRTLTHAQDVGAACPKILFADRFQEVLVEVPDAARIGSDPRLLGVRLSGVRFDGERDDSRVEFDEGFHLPEAPHRRDGEEIARWSIRRGAIRLRVTDAPTKRVSLRVSSLAPRMLRVRSGEASLELAVDGRAGQWIDVDVDPAVFDVVNNAGSNLYEHGFGGDRGFLERDEGQFDDPADVFAWCGGAVALSRAYLDDVGVFDERLFLYYEDTDLSWRGRLRGWTYRYVPESVVRHHHAQSSVAWSPTFRYYTERNRMLVLAKNAPARLAARAISGAVERFVKRLVRDTLLRPMTLRMPARGEVVHQWRVLRDYVRLAPGMLRDRRAMRPAVSRESLIVWETSKRSDA